MNTSTLHSPALAELDEALLQDIVRRIVERFHPRRIILFGSRARGEARADSDVDLFIEMDSVDPPHERRFKIRSLFPYRRWSMDILAYTPDEVAQRQNSLLSLVPIIEQEGKLLYERQAS